MSSLPGHTSISSWIFLMPMLVPALVELPSPVYASITLLSSMPSGVSLVLARNCPLF